MITIAGTAERHGESRVALSPEAAKKLTALGCLVKVETGAGTFSRFNDDAMKVAGAQIARNASDALEGADILLKVRRPTANEIKALEPAP
jgi:proton-translocating NAD(P)+ transhydrogenase subunit alpha